MPTNVRLRSEMRARLRAIAHAQGRTLSELLRLIIERGEPFAADFPPKDRAGLLHPAPRPASPPAASDPERVPA